MFGLPSIGGLMMAGEEEEKQQQEDEEQEQDHTRDNFSLEDSPTTPTDELLKSTANGDWEAAEATISEMRQNRRGDRLNDSRRVRSQLALLNQEEKNLRERLKLLQSQKRAHEKLLAEEDGSASGAANTAHLPTRPDRRV
jgi:hypothetical protein